MRFSPGQCGGQVVEDDDGAGGDLGGPARRRFQP